MEKNEYSISDFLDSFEFLCKHNFMFLLLASVVCSHPDGIKYKIGI